MWLVEGSRGGLGRRVTFADGVADDCAFWESHFGKLFGIKLRTNAAKRGCSRIKERDIFWRGCIVLILSVRSRGLENSGRIGGVNLTALYCGQSRSLFYALHDTLWVSFMNPPPHQSITYFESNLILNNCRL